MPDYSNYNARTYNAYGEIWRNTGKCVFCDLKDKYIITEKNKIVLTMNIFPYIDGHLLIIPRRHFESFEEMTKKEWSTMKDLADIGKKLIEKVTGNKDVWFLYRMPKGWTAQKTVPHMHAHLIPFHKDLFKWDYQEIKNSPEEFAKEFRKAL